MKKRVIALILSVILTMSSTVSVLAANEVMVVEEKEAEIVSEDVISIEEDIEIENAGASEGDFEYVIDGVEEYARITGYNGLQSDVRIPSTMEGYPVKYVGGFSGNLLIEKVTVPEGVEKLSSGCFSGCKNLSEIILPNSLEEMGDRCFKECEALESIIIPEKIERINDWVFQSCTNLQYVSMPNDLKEIGFAAFNVCIAMEEIQIPESVTKIMPYAFRYCCNLKSIKLPKLLAEISYGTFADCTNLTQIEFPECPFRILRISGTEYGAFENTGFKELYFPPNTESIGMNAFANCNNLEKVTVSGRNTDLSLYPFYGPKLNKLIFFGDTYITLDRRITKDACFYGIINSQAYKYAMNNGYNFYKINAPTGLQIENKDASSVRVVWNAVNHVAGYKIYRSDSENGDYRLLASLATNEYIDVGLENRPYYYKVCVYYENDGDIEGILTDSVGRKLKKIEMAEISFDKIQFYTGKEIEPAVAIIEGNELLEEGVDYRINYTDNIEAGKASMIVEGIGEYYGTITTSFEIVNLAQPVLNNIEIVSYNTITLDWDAVQGVSGYTIYRKMDGDEWEKIGKVSGENNCTYKDETVKPGFLYYYTVSAHYVLDDAMKIGRYDETGLNIKTSFAKPVISSVKRSGNKTLKITWKKVGGAQGYVIYRSTSKDGKYSKIKTITNGNILNYTNTNLKNAARYYYRIRAYCKNGAEYGYSTYSDKVSEVAKTQITVTKPTVVSVKKNGKGKLNIAWKKVSGVQGYVVYRADSVSGTYRKIKTVNGANTVGCVDSGLKSNKIYYYKLRAIKKIGGKNYYSSYSEIKSGKTLDTFPGTYHYKKNNNTVRVKINSKGGSYVAEAYGRGGKMNVCKPLYKSGHSYKAYYDDNRKDIFFTISKISYEKFYITFPLVPEFDGWYKK